MNFACGEWEECLGIVKGNMPLTDMAVKAEEALNAFHSSKTTGILPISKECSSISPWIKKTGGEESTAANDTHHFNEPPMLLELVANDVATLRSDKGGKFKNHCVSILFFAFVIGLSPLHLPFSNLNYNLDTSSHIGVVVK